MFIIPTGLACWTNACHESLLCAIIFQSLGEIGGGYLGLLEDLAWPAPESNDLKGYSILLWEGYLLYHLSWEGVFTLLRKTLVGGVRIFYTYFCCRQGRFRTCNKTWYGICHLPHIQDQFQTSGNLVNEDETEFGELYCAKYRIWRIWTQNKGVSGLWCFCGGLHLMHPIQGIQG